MIGFLKYGLKTFPIIQWLRGIVNHAPYFFKTKKLFLGQNTRLYDVYCSDYISFGNDCFIKNVKIESYTYIASQSNIQNCTIGKFCSIGDGVKIAIGTHPHHYLSTSPLFYSIQNPLQICLTQAQTIDDKKKSNIGNDVWIGANAFIANGINIGDGAIIAAGAIVTQDVLPYTIVGGVPAKLIKNRFPKETVEYLLKLQWWTKPIDEIKQNQALFQLDWNENQIIPNPWKKL